ncbi:phage holin family protein [Enterobacter roggenkampii]|uniref:phage holin family protein n=1 Tax=Enterobacter roggenkampii TaxID=1812935 RepID=UPI002237E37B|nr:phage holin family protein [Enterobacter roggenkampii]MCW5003517.1 phage holin family protein [Enterobacter roggenkampii]
MSGTLTTAGGLTASTIGITFATYFPEATPAVMLCALAGAALFVLKEQDYKLWKQLVFALISFIGGVYCAGMASQIIAVLINACLRMVHPEADITVTPAVGALAASTVAVTVLLRLLVKSRDYVPTIRQGGDA